MAPRPPDTLFTRLLLAQVGLLVSALLIFGTLLAVERNQLQVQLYTADWARQVLAMARTPITAIPPAPAPYANIRRHETLPPGFKLPVARMPAVQDFIHELARYGVDVDDVRLNYEGGDLTLWAQVRFQGEPAVWLSGNGASARPHWSAGVFAGVGVLFLLIGAVSWRFTRRVTRPLAELRQHMQAHARTGIQPGDAPPPLQPGQAPLELLEIEAAYLQLAERLRRNERERALLLAGVSHDLRSPLTRIRLAAEMLPESADNAAGVASITRNVDLADRLTASFLEFIRTSTVALDQVVDLAATARQVVASFERPGHELRVLAPPTLWLQGAHALLVERLIANLVDNALKHGGAPVAVEVVGAGDTAILTVSDTGPGLPQEGSGRLMEAFARGDASRGLPGFGLGLAISQQIVVRLQGELAFGHANGLHQIKVRLPLRR